VASLQDYAQLKAFYNGSPITQITSIRITTNSGNVRVDLLNEGLGGFTNGTGDVTIEIGFAVPVTGLEFDYQQDAANHEYVDLQIFIGRASYAGRGKIETNDISQSTGAAVEGTFTWVGELKPFE
jgi:hypothetical protein